MPEMNGYEFYGKVREIDPSVRMCMMTAYEEVPTDSRGNDRPEPPLDSRFVIKKPFDLEKILGKLEEMLSDGQDSHRKT